MEERICQIVADALYIDRSEVSMESNLMRDLGAESIDFLDIVFRLEKEFGIKIPKGEIERRAQGHLSPDEFAINGRLTEAGLKQLSLAMPEVDQDEIKAGLYARDIGGLFRVGTFVRLVSEQVGDVGASGTKESSFAFESRI